MRIDAERLRFLIDNNKVNVACIHTVYAPKQISKTTQELMEKIEDNTVDTKWSNITTKLIKHRRR